MKKNVLFALICACVMGFAASSCSSDESDKPVYDKDKGKYIVFIQIIFQTLMTSMVSFTVIITQVICILKLRTGTGTTFCPEPKYQYLILNHVLKY